MRIFISYSHKDEQFRKGLETALSPMKREGLITVWTDRCIKGGEDWEQLIHEELENADVILFLVSNNFFESNYAYGIEAKRALERHEDKSAIVVPVIVRESDWENAPFAKLQALPEKAKPIDNWRQRDRGYTNVVRSLRQMIKSRGSSPSAKVPNLGQAAATGGRSSKIPTQLARITSRSRPLPQPRPQRFLRTESSKPTDKSVRTHCRIGASSTCAQSLRLPATDAETGPKRKRCLGARY
jgi:hypothetical protein